MGRTGFWIRAKKITHLLTNSVMNTIELKTALNRTWLISFCIGCLLLGGVFLPGNTRAEDLHLQGEAKVMPWSGWWWPKNRGELAKGYNGSPSPAEKYDYYTTGSYHGTTYFQAMHEWYDPEALDWEGFCNGWVNASILEPEPRLTSFRKGVFLGIGDKKGLLTACHFKDEVLFESCKWKPAVFHEYMLRYLSEEGQVVAGDLDAGPEFWSHPIYSFEMTVTPRAGKDYITCTIKYASDFVDPDFVGIAEKSKTFHYNLVKNQEGVYTGEGEWLDDDHPQSVWIPVAIRQDQLFVDYRQVAEMAHSVGDECERGALVPGHHRLVVNPGNDAVFIYVSREGEKVRCRLALDIQSPAKCKVKVRLPETGEIIRSLELNPQMQEIDLTDLALDRKIELAFTVAGDAVDAWVHLLVDVEAPYVCWFYGYPDVANWVGCGIAPAGATGGRAWIETVDHQGTPRGRGGISSRELELGGNWLFALDQNFYKDFDYGGGDPVAVKLVSNFPNYGVILRGNAFSLLGTSDYLDLAARELVVPWLTRVLNFTSTANFSLHNRSPKKVVATIRYYRNSGVPGNMAEVELPQGNIELYNSGRYPGQSDIDGWAEISADALLSGAARLKKGRKISDMLPLLRFQGSGLVSHLAVTDGWRSVLGLINGEEREQAISVMAMVNGIEIGEPLEIILDGHEKKEIDLHGALFQLSESELAGAWLKVDAENRFAGYLTYRFADQAQASIPVQSFDSRSPSRTLTPLAVVDGWWTGIVFVNTGTVSQVVELKLLDSGGQMIDHHSLEFLPGERKVANLAGLFAGIEPGRMATLKLEDAGEIKALVFWGGYYGTNQLAARIW